MYAEKRISFQWWTRHHVVIQDDFVKKSSLHSEKEIPIWRAIKSIEFFEKYFWDMIPRTLLAIENEGYVIYQEYIPWITLWEYVQNRGWVISNTLRESLLRYLERAEDVLWGGIIFDYFWTEFDENKPKWWNNATNLIVTPEERVMFVDTVDATDSIWRRGVSNYFLNKVMQSKRDRIDSLLSAIRDIKNYIK